MKDKVMSNGIKSGEIVVSGMSARLPECENIEEFRQKLYAGLDLVTDDDRRWPAGLHGLPTRTGKLKHLEYFDAMFFNIHGKQANVMDPQLRLMLECTYEALIDAGYNPSELRGSKTGVFVAVSASEADEYWTSDPDLVNGYGLSGCCRAMFANRVSYAFDFTGPSYAIDTACSGGFYALEQAIAAMEDGRCEAAIVSGLNLLLKPNCSLQLHRLHMLAGNGQCRAFDQSGEGYVRSEGITVIYLQKITQARRVYAHLIGAIANSDGYKEKGIFYPNGDMQKRTLYELYNRVGVNPNEVSYVEAHGPGTKVGDPQELNALTDVFCTKRQTPLLIGSVKTNLGHTEPASGLCGLIKVVLAMECGIMPANLYYKNPHPEIQGLKDGRLQVVTENLQWNGGYVGINSFGFGGTNSHVIIKSFAKPKLSINKCTHPRLFMVSGRTETAVNHFLEQLKPSCNDNELLSLLNDINKINITGHGYRGYDLLLPNRNKSIRKLNNELVNTNREIWFFYSGVGTQWPNMAYGMMDNSIFAATIRKCCSILNAYDYNLEAVLLHSNAQTFDNVLNLFVAITAVQCALTDLLHALNIVPNGIIGHSAGEISCAYADGCFTLEEAILTAYFRGKAMLETELGAMASINLSVDECAKICPEGIYPVCHNSADNTTVSGSPELITQFVDMLESRQIFARVIQTAGKAFHSRYITKAVEPMQKYLKNFIRKPNERSRKWISTSVPETEWNISDLARYNSAEYHLNNIFNPVLFHEHSKYIPDNAIVIEVAGHGLFQSLFKTSLKRCEHVSLMKRNHENNLEFFMENIGKLYLLGGQPDLSVLCPSVTYPVGRGTLMLGPLVEWDHSVQWDVPLIESTKHGSGQRIVEIDLNKENDQYLLGHEIDGRVMFPPQGYLVLIWQTYAKMLNVDFETLPIIMENIHFNRPIFLQTDTVTKFQISLLEGTGNFEIRENNCVIVSGKVSRPEATENEFAKLPGQNLESNHFVSLSQNDIYKELRLRGYNLTNEFQSINTYQSDSNTSEGQITWNKNWISFLNAITQFLYLNLYQTRDLYLPVQLEKIIIDPKKHSQIITNLNNNLPVKVYKECNTIQCGGIEIKSLTSNIFQRRQTQIAKLEHYTFIPYNNHDKQLNRMQILTILIQNIIENSSNALKLKITELTHTAEDILTKDIIQVIETQPIITYDYSVISNNKLDENTINILKNYNVKLLEKDLENDRLDQNVHLVIAKNLIHTKSFNNLHNCSKLVKTGGMLLLVEPLNISIEDSIFVDLDIVCTQADENNKYILLRKPIEEKLIQNNSIIIRLTETNYNWIETMKTALEKSEQTGLKIYLIAEKQQCSGILGLTLSLLKEPNGENIRCVFIKDKNAEPFLLTSQFYLEQLKKDLVCNVLENGVWGTYRHILLENQTNETDLKLIENAFLNIKTIGDLSSLRWLQESDTYNKRENVCQVYCTSINIRDIILTTGKLPVDSFPGDLDKTESNLGSEFAGRDAQGNRVFGLASTHALATTVCPDSDFIWPIPEKWTMEEAATIPIAYATVYYALIIRGRMQRGESILINGATSAVSQAAIAVALSMNCNVFTTVGSDAKRRYIRNRFPEIPDRNIGTTKDTSFEQLIMNATNGHGVNLVLNHYSDQILQASIRCLAKNGRFLEIGKIDFYQNTALGMNVFSKNISFYGVMLDVLSETNPKDKLAVKQLIQEGINNGIIQPLTRTIFNETQIEEAFRYMMSDNDLGKVTLRLRDEEESVAQKLIEKKKFIWAVPRTYFNPTESYLIIGGLGGFGLELTNWLVNRGARNLLLTSKRGLRKGYQSHCIERWRAIGCRILVSTQDIVSEKATQTLIDQCQELGPLGGIFNLAAVFHDAYMENQTVYDFETVCVPKIQSTIHLDTVSRQRCKELKHFVVFSSVSCGRGNAGQTSYAYANSVMERICELRRQDAKPALAIQWGAIDEVGHILETMDGRLNEVCGTIPQKLVSCLQSLDYLMLLQETYPILACHVLNEKFGKISQTNHVSLLDAIGNILGLKNVENIQSSMSLMELGLESIMEAEIKQTLERNYDLVLTAKEIRNLTFAELNELNQKI